MWRNYVGRGVLPNNVYAIDIYYIEVGLSPCYGGHGVTKYFVFYMPTLCVFLYFMYATENISYTNLNLCIPHTHTHIQALPPATPLVSSFPQNMV